MSQSIWMGGLPMTMTADTASTCGNNYRSVWRYCATGGKAGESPWEEHIGIVSYFTKNPLPAVDPYTTSAEFNHVLPDRQKGSSIPALGTDVTAKPAIKRGDLDGLLEKPYFLGRVLDPEKLATTVQFKLSQSGSPGLVKGDYMWIGNGLGTRSHGLLIAGWGEVKNCADVLNLPNSAPPGNRVGPDELEYSFLEGQPYVPYVVDFVGTHQQPIPRPFYCTFYDAPDWWGYMDTEQGWYSFHLRDSLTIYAANNDPFLYVDPSWNWIEE